MGKGICRSRIRKVIGRHVYRLHGGNGTVLGGSNALLEGAHLRLQGGLVAYRGRHTAKKRGHLGTCLGETENIVNKQKYILSAFITEVLCHGEPGKTYTHTRPRRLVHLTEYHGRLIDNAGFLHFIV